MNDFFTARVDGYDEHMKSNIEGASDFYRYTAEMLPNDAGAKVLDLGCGTGLELEEFFKANPNASVTGIDLTKAMLDELKKKFPEKDLDLICGSYFEEPFGEKAYDAAVSVESLHHFNKEKKLGLYNKLHGSLKDNGYFILTDYFFRWRQRFCRLWHFLFYATLCQNRLSFFHKRITSFSNFSHTLLMLLGYEKG